eukprot:SAG22_NODE_2112_length_2995_cov_1.672307_1_plen_47_part_00
MMNLCLLYLSWSCSVQRQLEHDLQMFEMQLDRELEKFETPTTAVAQ